MKITQRIDNVTLVSEDYAHDTLPPPKSVKIELTARCDFACFFCATRLRLREKQDMDWDLLKSLLRQIRNAGVPEIGLFYLGESFLYPKLVDAIRYAKHDCGFPYVFLTTNGRLAVRDRVEACVRAGLDSLKFSFNSADPEQFKEVTSLNAFDTVVQNIKDARAAIDAVFADTGRRCGLYASSILYDGEQKARMTKAVEEIRPFVDEHYYLPLYNQAGFIGKKGSAAPIAGNVGRVGALREPIPCWSIFTEGHITYDGRLSACCFDHDGRFSMGDLKTTPFMEAWNSEKFRALRKAHLARDVKNTVCEKCIAYQG